MRDGIECDMCREEIYRRVCGLIGSIFFYGNFKAETHNERELEAALRRLGYFFESEDQLISKLHPELTRQNEPLQ